MNRSLCRNVGAIWLPLFLVGTSVAQLEINVSGRTFKAEDSIGVKVTNKSELPVSYCVEIGQWSPHAGTIESTPIPFYVEAKRGGSWKVLMIGPDIGSSRHPVTLETGASNEFPFRLNNLGQMRLLLYYWIGRRNDVCDDSTEGRKTARSKGFSIVKD
jgi:hypothetical protein